MSHYCAFSVLLTTAYQLKQIKKLNNLFFFNINFIKKYSPLNEVNDEIKSFRCYPGFIYIFLFNVNFVIQTIKDCYPGKGIFSMVSCPSSMDTGQSCSSWPTTASPCCPSVPCSLKYISFGGFP